MRAVVPKMSLRISSAALGAAWVSETIADLLGTAIYLYVVLESIVWQSKSEPAL